MENEPRVRPMSREENAAYRGVTVDEYGEDPQGDSASQSGAAAHGSVRYIRIGMTRRSPFAGLLWTIALTALIALFIFVALPAIAMIFIGVLVLGAMITLLGRGRVWSWLLRRLYGR